MTGQMGQRGFTLMEIILVMIIGSSLLFAGSLVYNSLRESAGAANAKAKVASLHQTIERLSTQTGEALPSIGAVRTEWKRTRADYASSPWSGAATCSNDTTFGRCDDYIREVTVCVDASTRCLNDFKVNGEIAVLLYAHYATNDIDPKGTSFFSSKRYTQAFIDTFDHSQKAYVTTSRYAVGTSNANGRGAYFVQGPAYTASSGQTAVTSVQSGTHGACGCSSTDLSGQVGDPSPIQIMN